MFNQILIDTFSEFLEFDGNSASSGNSKIILEIISDREAAMSLVLPDGDDPALLVYLAFAKTFLRTLFPELKDPENFLCRVQQKLQSGEKSDYIEEIPGAGLIRGSLEFSSVLRLHGKTD